MAAPVAGLWALEACRARFTGTHWIEALLAAAALAGGYRLAAGVLADGVLGLRVRADALPVLAAGLGFSASFLLSLLEAAGRLPARLEDPRGGPVSLYAGAATVLLVRVWARKRQGKPSGCRPARTVEAVGSEASGAPPAHDLCEEAPAGLWLSLAGSVALSLGMSLPLSAAGGGAAALTAAVMAILAAISLEACEASGVEAPIERVALEKAGVLTSGAPEVVGVFPLRNDLRPEDVLHLAAAAEYSIRHPIREAILRGCDARFRTIPSIKSVRHIPARGIRARYNEKEMLLGNVALFREQGWPPGKLALLEKKCVELSPEGETVLFLSLGGELAGALSLQDPLLPAAEKTVRAIKELGAQVHALSGDTPHSVEKLLGRLGSVEVHAGLSPQDEVRLLEEWRGEGCRFAVVRCAERGGVAVEPGARYAELAAEAKLGAALIVLAEKKVRARSQKRRAWLVGAYHAAALPLLSGSLEPWTGVPPLPVAAACAGVLLPGLLSAWFKTGLHPVLNRTPRSS